MSQAFVKESDGEWLHDVAPTLTALIAYLTRENNGIRVYEKKQFFHETLQREAHLMSNGFTYARDAKGTWFIAD